MQTIASGKYAFVIAFGKLLIRSILSFFMKHFQICNLTFKNRLFLAPMVEVTDLPYREICRNAGAAMAYTEMIYIDAILHENKKTKNLMKVGKGETPVGLQITGNNETEFEKFVLSKKWKPFDLIDLNCGCPSVRITGNEAGSYLLKNPKKIANMVGILKKTGKPITVKIRLGFKKNNVLKVARLIEKAGADALTVHARLATQGGETKADWSWIEKVRQTIKIPLIGNGDVVDGKSAQELLQICDVVMIARAAIGDPFVFERILKYLARPPALTKLDAQTGSARLVGRARSARHEKVSSDDNSASIDIAKNFQAFRDYLKLQKKYYDAEVDLGRVKYLGGKFLRGFDGAAKRREELMRLKTIGEVEKFVSLIKN